MSDDRRIREVFNRRPGRPGGDVPCPAPKAAEPIPPSPATEDRDHQEPAGPGE